MTVADLEAISAVLRDRLATETSRPPHASGTELVGGVVKAASTLESLLRHIVMHLLGVGLDDRVPGLGRLRKAMSGPLVGFLRDRFKTKSSGLSPEVKPVIDDLLSANSTIEEFVEQRNSVAKRGADPSTAKPALLKLHSFIVEYRKHAGWP